MPHRAWTLAIRHVPLLPRITAILFHVPHFCKTGMEPRHAYLHWRLCALSRLFYSSPPSRHTIATATSVSFSANRLPLVASLLPP